MKNHRSALSALAAVLLSFAALLPHATAAETNEVRIVKQIGLGFLPASVPDRRLINIAGIANQILAERAQSVVMMVSGVPLRLR